MKKSNRPCIYLLLCLDFVVYSLHCIRDFGMVNETLLHKSNIKINACLRILCTFCKINSTTSAVQVAENVALMHHLRWHSLPTEKRVQLTTKNVHGERLLIFCALCDATQTRLNNAKYELM